MSIAQNLGSVMSERMQGMANSFTSHFVEESGTTPLTPATPRTGKKLSRVSTNRATPVFPPQTTLGEAPSLFLPISVLLLKVFIVFGMWFSILWLAVYVISCALSSIFWLGIAVAIIVTLKTSNITLPEIAKWIRYVSGTSNGMVRTASVSDQITQEDMPPATEHHTAGVSPNPTQLHDEPGAPTTRRRAQRRD